MDSKKRSKFIATILVFLFLLIVAVPVIINSSTYTPNLITNLSPSLQQIVSAKSPISPFVPWWNTNFNYRIRTNLTDTAGKEHVNEPMDIFLTFESGHCHKNSPRVQYWNGTNWLSEPIPYQIWNSTDNGTHYESFTITFYVNISAFSTANYYVYYSGTDPGPVSYTPQVNYSSSVDPYGNLWYYFGSQIYNASIRYDPYDSDPYDGKIYSFYNKITGEYWENYRLHYDPAYSEVLSSPDVSETSGPLFIMYNCIAREFGDYNVSITYRFFKWGWIGTINTTFNVSWYNWEWDTNGWHFKPYYMEKLTYKRQTGEIENITMAPNVVYNLGRAQWLCFWKQGSSRAIGLFDISPVDYQLRNYPYWRYEAHYYGSYEEWEREMYISTAPGDYIFEEYAIYLWDGSAGIAEFQTFAEGMKNPPSTSVGVEEPVFFEVNVHVKDYDNSNLADANVTVYNGSNFVGSEITNSTGWATFYLEPEIYNFNATWSGTTSYEFFKNSTTWEVNATQTDLELIFNNITTLFCRTEYQDGNPIQNAYINITKVSGEFVDSSPVNLTGWAEFHLNRSSVSGNYNITAYRSTDHTLLAEHTNMFIDNESDGPLYFTVPFGTLIYTKIIVSETSLLPAWGTNVNIIIYWKDKNGNNLSTSDPLVGGSLKWTLNFINGTKAPGGGPYTLSPQGSTPNIYYTANIPSSLLFGGVTYQVYINAEAGNTTYTPAANQTIIDVQPATLNVAIAPLTGPYYWKHSNIPLGIYVTNDLTGQPVTTATVTFTTTGGEVSGPLTHSGSGNYNYIIPAGVVEANLDAATYGLRFTVSNTNYTTNQPLTQLVISPAQTEFLLPNKVKGYYGDILSISVIYRDKVDKTPISTGIVSYSVMYQDLYGNLVPSSGNWTGDFDSSLVEPNTYFLQLTADSANYEGHTGYIPLDVEALPIQIKSDNLISSTVYENLLISIQLNDTYNDEPILNADVFYSVIDGSGSTVASGNLYDTGNNATYYSYLSLDPHGIPPGTYIIELIAVKENYMPSQKVIQLIVKGVPTVLSASNFPYFSSLNNPAEFYFGNFGQIENNGPFPFAIFTFRFTDSEGSPIPNANVSAGGWPLINMGNGKYAVVIPTSGLPASSYPIVVSAGAELYESQQSLFLLRVNDRSISIPFVNIRIPFNIFLTVLLAVAIPVSTFSGYMYVKRVRTPRMIRRINQIAEAINRGEGIDVKLVPRDTILTRILAREALIVGVELGPDVYLPVELADRLVPMLTEVGLTEEEARAILIELRKLNPADREVLLASIGIPVEIGGLILQLIKEEEDRFGIDFSVKYSTIEGPEVSEEPKVLKERPEEKEDREEEDEDEGDEWEAME
ncbi:MAG: hypothetical protein ACETWM_00665 [Candidatus Lokiarchaeia archaeon]